MNFILRAALAALLAASPSVASAELLTIDGRKGPLDATLVRPAPYATTVVIVPDNSKGSGKGMRATAGATDYRPMAEALRERGFGSLRVDPAPSGRPRAKAHSADVRNWVNAAMQATGSPCVWLLAHGQGAHAAVAAAREDADDLCGVILVGAPARALEGEKRDKKLTSLADVALPTMIVVGSMDGVAHLAEGQALHAALPDARFAMVLGMDRSLGDASTVGSEASDSQSAGPRLVSDRLMDALGTFMLDKGPQVQGSLQRKKGSSRGSRRAALDSNGSPASVAVRGSRLS